MSPLRTLAALACVIALGGAAACSGGEPTREAPAATPAAASDSTPDAAPDSTPDAAPDSTGSAPAGTAEASGDLPVAGVALPENGATVVAETFAASMAVPGTVILDVRSPAEFADGHIEGATNIDINAADFTQQLDGLDKATPYAVYCRSGNRSAAALDEMKNLGFTQTYHLDGGVGAWQSSGRPLAR